jgi:hypothetical protein
MLSFDLWNPKKWQENLKERQKSTHSSFRYSSFPMDFGMAPDNRSLDMSLHGGIDCGECTNAREDAYITTVSIVMVGSTVASP